MPLLTKRARKDLDALPPPFAEKASELIRRLDNEPSLGKKLQGALEGKRSARLGRSHRVIYTASGGNLVVLTVAPRKDVYR
jgi:mRNA-degrading endonuclease RelE of RelBE toxin-antitoxin system